MSADLEADGAEFVVMTRPSTSNRIKKNNENQNEPQSRPDRHAVGNTNGRLRESGKKHSHVRPTIFTERGRENEKPKSVVEKNDDAGDGDDCFRLSLSPV
jgi:hypothetical protein